VLQYIAQRRWIPWHLLCVAALVGCVWMARWQWEVATSPMPAGVQVSVWRNYAYAINWVVFAGVAVWFWWRFLRDQMHTEAAQEDLAVTSDAPVNDVAAAQRPAAGGEGLPGVSGPAGTQAGSTAQPTNTEPVVRQRRFDPFADA